MTLTARAVTTAKDGSFSDGNGLYLRVRNGGSTRFWVFRWKIAGKVRELGLGGVSVVSLAQARDMAIELKRAVKSGDDPALVLHPEAACKTPAFAELAQETIEALRPGWRNVKHAAQWEMTLREYAFPTLGKMLPGDIGVEHVLRVLKPLWTTKTETATRLRQRIEAVLDRAAVLGYRDRERVNPASWKGNLEHLLAKPRAVRERTHFAAVPYRELPGVTAKLRDRQTMSAFCVRMIALTACRSGEIRGLRWEEIDTDAKAMTIPGSRTKTKKAHTVPLSAEAMQILEHCGQAGRDGVVFPGRKGQPMTDVAASKELHLFAPGATVHGLRSSFRDWAADQTRHSREVVEQCLAHAIGSVEGSYRRTDLLEKRRAVMNDWASYLAGAKIVRLKVV